MLNHLYASFDPSPQKKRNPRSVPSLPPIACLSPGSRLRLKSFPKRSSKGGWTLWLSLELLNVMKTPWKLMYANPHERLKPLANSRERIINEDFPAMTFKHHNDHQKSPEKRRVPARAIIRTLPPEEPGSQNQASELLFGELFFFWGGQWVCNTR